MAKIKRKDKFIEKGTRFFFSFVKYKKQITYGVCGIIIVSAVSVYMNKDKQKKEALANRMFMEAVMLYGSGDIENALTRFEDLNNLYKTTEAGIKSLYWVGNIYYLQGRYKEARDYFEKYAKKGKDNLIIQASLLGIGDTYFQENNIRQAITKYKSLVEKYPDSFLAPKTITQIIECYKLFNNFDSVNFYLQKLSKNYPNSLFR